MSKKVWILEQSANPLKINEDKEQKDRIKSYILSGPCADFTGKNDNNRLYSEDDYLKHLGYLKEQADANILLGSADHDEDYNVSMKEVSHIIKDVWFDKEKQQVWIKIELVETRDGKDLMALVDKSVPLFISSRATGFMNEDTGDVIIDTIYTYDVVYRPGFPCAKMKRVDESKDYGKRVAIYEFKNPEETINTNENKNNNMEFATKEEMQNFSKIINESIKEIRDELKEKNKITLQETNRIGKKKNNLSEGLIPNGKKFKVYTTDATKPLYEGEDKAEAEKAAKDSEDKGDKTNVEVDGEVVTPQFDPEIQAVLDTFQDFKEEVEKKLETIQKAFNDHAEAHNNGDFDKDDEGEKVDGKELEELKSDNKFLKESLDRSIGQINKLIRFTNIVQRHVQRLEEGYDISSKNSAQLHENYKILLERSEKLVKDNALMTQALKENKIELKSLSESSKIKSSREKINILKEEILNSKDFEVVSIDEDKEYTDGKSISLVVSLKSGYKKEAVNSFVQNKNLTIIDEGKGYVVIDTLIFDTQINNKSNSVVDGKVNLAENKNQGKKYELIKNQKPFFEGVSNKNIDLFETLTPIKKKKLENLMLENSWKGEIGFSLALDEINSDPEVVYLESMPKELQPIWEEKLNKQTKIQIMNLFKRKQIVHPEEARLIWESLNLEQFSKADPDGDNEVDFNSDEVVLGYKTDDIDNLVKN